MHSRICQPAKPTKPLDVEIFVQDITSEILKVLYVVEREREKNEQDNAVHSKKNFPNLLAVFPLASKFH